MKSPKIVSALPVLSPADYPPVPTNNEFLIPWGSPLVKYELECLLGAVALAARASGAWRAVGDGELAKILSGGADPAFGRHVRDFAQDLAEQGQIEILRFEGRDYLVPTPRFARIFAEGHLRPAI